MKLIDALIVASQEFGLYGDWTVQRGQEAHITLWEEQYTSYLQGELVGQSERLEVVIACLAEKAAHVIYDEHWQVSRSIGTPEKHTGYREQRAMLSGQAFKREMYGDFTS